MNIFKSNSLVLFVFLEEPSIPEGAFVMLFINADSSRQSINWCGLCPMRIMIYCFEKKQEPCGYIRPWKMIISRLLTNVETYATVQLPLGKEVIIRETQRLFTGWMKRVSTRTSDHPCYVKDTMHSLT